ncbi:MAG: insulinase family protein [Phycisphaerales bacterium]|nr:insulinase family protein [Phycisphaerales bacterium]
MRSIVSALVGRLAVAALFCLCAMGVRAQPLPSDPSLVTGELDNGLRYIIRKHAVPPGRATIWVHIHSGSLNETDQQRGLAHYLEHMAFNGSANFAPGTLVPFFQSLGMQFGRDQNAFTNSEQTTYQLSLPDTKDETLTKGFTFFADVVGRMSLLPNEIEEERGIIQEERRRGLSGRQRTGFYIRERIAPGSLLGQRITIGTEETINAVKEQDFRDYYNKWYAASNATLMVVADTDPANIVKVINATFSDLPKKPKPVGQDPGVKAYDKSFAIVAHDPEVRSEDIRITKLGPARPAVTTLPLMREDLVATLAERAMNRRLSDKNAKGDTSYLNARVSLGGDTTSYDATISGSAKPGQWKATLSELALEMQRARAFGFTTREIEDAKKELIAGAERAVETEATTPAQGIISGMNGAVTAGEPIMSPAQRLQLFRDLIPSITTDEASKRFATEFDPKAVCFVAVLPSGDGVPTESELLDLGLKALSVQPTKETEATRATQLMASEPKGGSFTEFTEHAASKVWSGWLNNNVRVHYRFMDQRKNQVNVQISLYGGEMLETAENRGITSAAQLAWSRAATKQLASTDIRELMTGKKVNVRGGGFGGGGGRGGRGGGMAMGGSDSMNLSISGSPEELETGFQLAYLLLTEPKIEAAALDQMKISAKEMLAESTKNPMMFGMRSAAAAPYPDDDARFHPPTTEQIDAISVEKAQAWLEKMIATSPIEVAIVGDLPKEKAVQLVEKYLGSLAKRDRVTPELFAAQRQVKRPAGPRVIEKKIETPTPQAFVLSGFYGPDQKNLREAYAMSIAARVLSTRMVKEVREDAQLVYSIGASSRSGTTYPGFGVFSAGAPTEPAKVKPLVEKLASMYAAFAKDGPTSEELEVARKQFAKNFEEQLIEPAFWQTRLESLTFRGIALDDMLKQPEVYAAMPADEIKATFAKYATPDNAIVVNVSPESK